MAAPSDAAETGPMPQRPGDRPFSHQEYLETLHRPTAAEVQRITEIQLRREAAIDEAYHSIREQKAATTIQKAYRGHRERRQLEGLSLDPSSRWSEAIREWRYRAAIAPAAPQQRERKARSPSDLARLNWYRIGQIAEHAGGFDGPVPATKLTTPPTASTETHAGESLLLDSRYFLEMVDVKHRYGANLQVYHEEWKRSEAEQNFFFWLEHGDGRGLSLPYCDRAKLERERVRYLSREERRNYLVRVDEDGRLRWEKNDELITTSVDMYKDSKRGIVPKDASEPTATVDEVAGETSPERVFDEQLAALRDGVDCPKVHDEPNEDDHGATEPTHPPQPSSHPPAQKRPPHHFHVSPATILNSLLRASVRPGTWIYVADTTGRLYVGIKSGGAFQHASFLSGARIASAGSIGITDGQLVYLSPLSGHYRPTTKSFRDFLHALGRQGVDLSAVRVSRAYEVLLGMECYGRTRKSLSRARHLHRSGERAEEGRRRSGVEAAATGEQLDHRTASATALVDLHWREEHEVAHDRGLARLMDDLHIRRRSRSGGGTR